MKVAVISNGASTLVNFRGPLIKEMVRRGYRVLAFAPDYNEDTRLAVCRLGAEPVSYALSRTGLNPFLDIVSLWQLIRLFLTHRPDLTLAYFMKPVIYGTLAAKLAGVPRRYAMIEGMGFAFTGDVLGWRRRFLQWVASSLLRRSLSYATRLILLNPDDHREFLDRRLVAPEKTAILGGIGVDLDEWSYAEPNIEGVNFTFVGRLLRDKGVAEFVAAAAAVRQQYPQTKFVLVGGHDVNPAAIPLTQIEEWVRQGIVEWLGHIQVLPALRRASVFVLPSYREGVPRSTQEAMAMGMPVITTDVPGCRETVIDGVNGFYVPARDVSALTQAILYFVRAPEKIVPMGVESRRIAEERFDVHRQNGKLLDLIGL